MRVKIYGRSDDLIYAQCDKWEVEYGAWGGGFLEFTSGDVVYGEYTDSWEFEHVEGQSKMSGSFITLPKGTEVVYCWSHWPPDEEADGEALRDQILHELEKNGFDFQLELLKELRLAGD